MRRPLLATLTAAAAALSLASVYGASNAAPKDPKDPTPVVSSKPAAAPKNAAAAPASAAPKADQDAYTLDAWDFQDPAKFKGLMKEREDLQLKLFALRVKLISEDPELQKLHKQIMALHKELAIQLDAKKDMRKLTDKLRDLDSDLEKLPRKDGK